MPIQFTPPYNIQENKEAGLVSLYFAGLNRKVLDEARSVADSATRRIIGEELLAFGQNILAPTYRQFAPYKQGGSEDVFRLSAEERRAGKTYQWKDRGDHLRDSIRAEMRGQILTLVGRDHMRWQIDGRGEVTPRTKKVIRIELPGGEVIYRPAAKAISPDKLQWPKRAYQSLLDYQIPILQQRIASRLEYEVAVPALGLSAKQEATKYRETAAIKQGAYTEFTYDTKRMGERPKGQQRKFRVQGKATRDAFNTFYKRGYTVHPYEGEGRVTSHHFLPRRSQLGHVTFGRSEGGGSGSIYRDLHQSRVNRYSSRITRSVRLAQEAQRGGNETLSGHHKTQAQRQLTLLRAEMRRHGKSGR